MCSLVIPEGPAATAGAAQAVEEVLQGERARLNGGVLEDVLR